VDEDGCVANRRGRQAAVMPQEVLWQSDALPNGAFAKIHDIMAGGRRAVLAAIELNETVLAFKISGPGQNPTLSAFFKPSMKAVTIRVNHVEGVGGFVLQGDHIDIVLTRQIDAGSSTTQVVLQNKHVLGVAQTADERAQKAAIAQSVTLGVDPVKVCETAETCMREMSPSRRTSWCVG
jgi:pilus assembly protein CpaB